MMPTTSLVALTGWLACVAAQTSNPTVRAAVVFVNHGETTPTLVTEHVVLTPNGAQQMQRLGAAFRSRYLGGSASNTTSSNSTDAAPIQSLSADSIDNSQIAIMAGTQEWLTNSATAFMQGLYPPRPGSSNLDRNYELNSNTTDYPLNGYQYAQIITYPDSDSNSVAIKGDQACTSWQNQMNQNLSNSPEITQKASDMDYFYTKLFSSDPFQGSLPLGLATYLYADELYEYVKFSNAYNETVHKGLKDANGTLSVLEDNAFTLERAKTSYSGNTDKDDPLNVLYSIAGRTLANKVTDQFSTFLATSETRGKLTLMFGSSRPMMAFFGVGGLMNEQNSVVSPFSQLPKPGSAIVFELVGDTDSRGTTDGLQVRFWYKPSADSSDQFALYPLFGSGFGGAAMSYESFLKKMNEISKTPTEWCTICSPTTTSAFCVNQTFSEGQNGQKSGGSCSSAVSPAVAGVIGALLMAILVACVTAAVMGLGGWRFRRRPKQEGDAAGSAAGGFKGTGRMASDLDMTVTQAGRREERVGSWELRDGGKEAHSGPLGAGIVTSEFAKRTRTMDEDAVSVTGAPVNVRESV